MHRWTRYRIITAAVGATLLVVGAVAQAPGAKKLLRLSSGSVRAVAAVEEVRQPTDEVYALVDEVIGRAGARPVFVEGATGAETREVAQAAPRFLAEEDEPAEREVPWRRVPAVGMATMPRQLPPMPLPSLRAEPVAITHAPSAVRWREIPPLRSVPVYVAFSFTPLVTRNSDRIDALMPNTPVGGEVPNDLAPPAVGGSTPPGSPVPEPAGGMIIGLAAAVCLRRRR